MVKGDNRKQKSGRPFCGATKLRCRQLDRAVDLTVCGKKRTIKMSKRKEMGMPLELCVVHVHDANQAQDTITKGREHSAQTPVSWHLMGFAEEEIVAS